MDKFYEREAIEFWKITVILIQDNHCLQKFELNEILLHKIGKIQKSFNLFQRSKFWSIFGPCSDPDDTDLEREPTDDRLIG